VGLLAHGDEGMWTFDHPPLARIQAGYGVHLDQAWLDHARLSALRVGNGSGAFVSADGLILTNHHVVRQALEGVAWPGKTDYLAEGFVARDRTGEIPVPGLRVRTLMQTRNVTAQVNAAVKPGMDPAQARSARDRTLSDLAEDWAFKTRLLVHTDTLYSGAEYWMYAYKVYRDVRLVALPEAQIASFGGDSDNFTFPRHDLDFALLRAYELQAPYHPAQYLRWSTAGLRAGDLTCVVGNPGATRRQDSIAEMRFQRDVAYPMQLARVRKRCAAFREYAQGSKANAQQVGTLIFFAENSLKAIEGFHACLRSGPDFARMEGREAELRAAVAANPALSGSVADSWERIAAALEQKRPLVEASALVNSHDSALLNQALDTVRVVRETGLPARERLRAYRTRDDLAWMEWCAKQPAQLLSLDLETLLIRKGLEDLERQLDSEHPLRKLVLAGGGPERVAREAVAGTLIPRLYFREELLRKSPRWLDHCPDPMVRLACALEAYARANDRKIEQLGETIGDAGTRVAQARLALQGGTLYPDANGTLRLSFGPVEGYADPAGPVAPFTTIQDLFERARAKGPEAANGAWALPPRWLNGKALLDPRTPLNFCSKVDIIGGNSGSPVLNVQGECVGLVFDGNLPSLAGQFQYDPSVNRAVCVDLRAITEALGRLYGAGWLVQELVPAAPDSGAKAGPQAVAAHP